MGIFMLIFFLISILQLFFIYACITLGNHDPELDAYEDLAQDQYIKQWNERHKREKKKKMFSWKKRNNNRFNDV